MPGSAQENLLVDPGFDGQYRPSGRSDYNFPPPWQGWWTNSPSTESWMNVDPLAFPHSASSKRSGTFSLHMNRGFGTFTGAAWQEVTNIAPGTRLRASVWAFIENVSESGAQVRIGIGNNVGGNVLSPDVVWSGWTRTVQSWVQLTVEAVANGGSVTVFLYATQSQPNNPNGVYWDEASLIVIGEGEPTQVSGDGAVPAPTTAPPAVVAPFVSAQGARDDGSVVHTVQPGDTMAAISVAYGVPIPDLLQLNNMTDARLLSVGQQIIVRPATTAAEPAPETAPAAEEAPDEPAAEPAEPEPTATPEPTAIPVTPTEAPPAPVYSVASGDVFPAADPTVLESAVCFIMFDDENQNRIWDQDERLLSGGAVTLNNASGQALDTLETSDIEAVCFETLAAGDYTALATPPDGYGLTTPARLLVRVPPGTQFNLAFGAGEGVTVAALPPADDPSAGTDTTPDAAPPAEDGGLLSNAGLIVFGLAGLVLLGGLGITVVLRGR